MEKRELKREISDAITYERRRIAHKLEAILRADNTEINNMGVTARTVLLEDLLEDVTVRDQST